MIYSVVQRDQFSRQGRRLLCVATRAERAFLQGPFQPKTTKQTQSRRTRMETTPSRPTEALPRQPGMDAAPLSLVHAACLKQASRFTAGTAPRTPGGSLWRSAASSARAGPGVGRQRASRGGSVISSNDQFLLGYPQSPLAPKPVQPAHCISLSTCRKETRPSGAFVLIRSPDGAHGSASNPASENRPILGGSPLGAGDGRVCRALPFYGSAARPAHLPA